MLDLRGTTSDLSASLPRPQVDGDEPIAVVRALASGDETVAPVVREVRELMERFGEAQKMMRQMRNGGMPGMGGLPGMPGMGGGKKGKGRTAPPARRAPKTSTSRRWQRIWCPPGAGC